MAESVSSFPPTVKAAHDRLSAFAPRAGAAYAHGRNHDLGGIERNHVSALSPYLKVRLPDEATIARAVLTQHDAETADRFLAEVFWRTYWKGWMEMRPAVWDMYLSDIKWLRDDVQTQSGLRARWEAACNGDTGIAPFDHWARELARTHYLHNHARMWFASIWIFTLKLPWQLGADFFLRHLLDGDAAVNTLSWRWVAGIQTRGKTYLADPANIAQYTGGRFAPPTGLATQAQEVPYPEAPPAADLPAVDDAPPAGRYGLILHEDDIVAPPFVAGTPPSGRVFLQAGAAQSPWHMAPEVAAFRQALAVDACPGLNPSDVVRTAQDLHRWAVDNRLESLLVPYAPVGPTREVLEDYRALRDALPVSEHRRPLDSAAWPLATKGFFRFRKHIPGLIETFVSNGPGVTR